MVDNKDILSTFLLFLLPVVVSCSDGNNKAVENYINKKPVAEVVEPLEQKILQKDAITGIFIQPNNHYLGFNWDEHVKRIKDVGMDTIILQWSVENRIDWCRGLVSPLLKAADKRGVDVFVGLYRDPDVWNIIGKVDEKRLLDYIEKRAGNEKKILDKLVKSYSEHKSLAGWYLPLEIDDLNWNAPWQKDIILDYLKEVSTYAHEVSDKKVAIAPFFGGHISTSGFEQFWDYLLSNSKVDIVMLQDGVGTNRFKGNYEIVENYFAAMKKSADKNDVELWSDIEIFNQTKGWPVNKEQMFQADSANIERILQQIQTEKEFVDKFIAFSYQYLTGLEGKRGEGLYNELKNIKGGVKK